MLKALLFDVQGTATDFHSTIREAAASIADDLAPEHDWSDFVNRWRAAYFTETSQQPETGTWVSVASVYRRTLDPLLEADGIDLGKAERDEVALGDAEFSAEFDINAVDFLDLADQLGC